MYDEPEQLSKRCTKIHAEEKIPLLITFTKQRNIYILPIAWRFIFHYFKYIAFNKKDRTCKTYLSLSFFTFSVILKSFLRVSNVSYFLGSILFSPSRYRQNLWLAVYNLL